MPGLGAGRLRKRLLLGPIRGRSVELARSGLLAIGTEWAPIQSGAGAQALGSDHELWPMALASRRGSPSLVF